VSKRKPNPYDNNNVSMDKAQGMMHVSHTSVIHSFNLFQAVYSASECISVPFLEVSIPKRARGRPAKKRRLSRQSNNTDRQDEPVHSAQGKCQPSVFSWYLLLTS
jgi:hypothetical protein